MEDVDNWCFSKFCSSLVITFFYPQLYGRPNIKGSQMVCADSEKHIIVSFLRLNLFIFTKIMLGSLLKFRRRALILSC